MPTGYTSTIAEGISFNEFVLSCARAFGACIEMRDEPSDIPIPDEFKPSDYHAKALAKITKRMVVVSDMTDAECIQCALVDFEDAKRSLVKYISDRKELRSKYESMLVQVNAWQQPTEEHAGLKKFMQEQIHGSIKFDCGEGFYENELAALKPLSGTAWKAKELEQFKRDIAYHTKENNSEVKHAKERTEWVQQLRNSLK